MVVQKADWFFADCSVIIIGFDDKLDAKVLETGWSAAGCSGAKVLKTGSAGSDGTMFSKLLLFDDAKADDSHLQEQAQYLWPSESFPVGTPQSVIGAR